MQVTSAQKFNLKFTHSKLLILNLSKRKCLLKPYNIYLFYIFLLKKKKEETPEHHTLLYHSLC